MKKWSLAAAGILVVGLLIGWLYVQSPLNSHGVHWRHDQDGRLVAFAVELENQGRWPAVLTGVSVDGQPVMTATAVSNFTDSHIAANAVLSAEPQPQLTTGAVAGWRVEPKHPPASHGVRIDWDPGAGRPVEVIVHFRYLGLPMRLAVNPMLLNWSTPMPLEPVTVTLEPEGGPPGTEVTVRIWLREPEKAWAGGDGKSWNFQLCWEKCGPQQSGQAIWPKPSPTNKHLFVGKVQVPAFMNGARLQAGPVPVLLACTVAPTPDCLNHPEARATFQLVGELPAVAWGETPSGAFKPVSALDRGPSPSVDPTNPHRQLRCQSGSPNPNAGDPPHLRVTTDGWKTWEPISLQGAHLGAMAGISGCRAAALDPVSTKSFYVAGGGHRGLSGEGRFPRPAFTADGGATWNPVPAPAEHEPVDFLGFATSAESVTAWFAKPDSNGLPLSFAGSLTGDGGRTWETVPLECPPAGPCAWEVPTVLYDRQQRGLLRSDDGGKSWSWAQWEGARLEAMNRGFQMFYLAGNTIEVALAGNAYDRPFGYVPLLQSRDGGKTWTWVDLPEPPGGWMHDPDLQVQSDGSLLYRNALDQRYRLHRGAGAAWERLEN